MRDNTLIIIAYLQDDGNDRKEFPGGRELDSVVHLLPDRQVAVLGLVGRLERRSLLDVQNEKHELDTRDKINVSVALLNPLQRLHIRSHNMRTQCYKPSHTGTYTFQPILAISHI